MGHLTKQRIFSSILITKKTPLKTPSKSMGLDFHDIK